LEEGTQANFRPQIVTIAVIPHPSVFADTVTFVVNLKELWSGIDSLPKTRRAALFSPAVTFSRQVNRNRAAAGSVFTGEVKGCHSF
jgi:hypothetical protein